MRTLAALILLAIVLVAVAPAMAVPQTQIHRGDDSPRPVVLLTTRLYRPGSAVDMARPKLACLSGHASRFVISDGDDPVIDLALLPTVRTGQLLSLRVARDGGPERLVLLRPDATQTVVLPGTDRCLLDVTATLLENRAALDRALAVGEGTR